MNEDVKDLWICALLSDEYEQGTGQLTEPFESKHCCLGVLCKEAIKAGVKVEVSVHPTGIVSYDGKVAWLPKSVQEWADLAWVNPIIRVGKDAHGEYLLPFESDKSWSETLSTLNDTHVPFPRIAQFIAASL